MGNPAYGARRDAEQAEANARKARAEAAQAALDALTAFATGRASLSIQLNFTGSAAGHGGGWSIRLIRDVK